MKRYLTSSLLALSLFSIGSIVQAADKQVKINANVIGTCAFKDGANVIIGLGDLEAGTAVDKSKSEITQFWCSNGVTYNLSLSGEPEAGSTRVLTSGGNTLPYQLALSNKTGSGQGPGTFNDVTITATVLGKDIREATIADNYTDTVTLTVNP